MAQADRRGRKQIEHDAAEHLYAQGIGAYSAHDHEMALLHFNAARIGFINAHEYVRAAEAADLADSIRSMLTLPKPRKK